MNLKQALAYARGILANNDITEAALEGEVLVRHLLGMDRTQLFLNPDVELDAGQEYDLEQLLARRVKGEPSAYITGHREFYGLDFIVDRNVLIPRPETELLVEKAIELAGRLRINSVADAGTGCGAIAISLALHLPHVQIYATDISSAALEVAASNCRKYHVSGRITLSRDDMLGSLPEAVDLIVANLPYVKKSDLSSFGMLSHEPLIALNGGPDGLDKMKQLIRQVDKKLQPGGCVLAEIGQGQAISLSDFIKAALPGAHVDTYNDLAGIARVIEFSLTKNYSRW